MEYCSQQTANGITKKSTTEAERSAMMPHADFMGDVLCLTTLPVSNYRSEIRPSNN